MTVRKLPWPPCCVTVDEPVEVPVSGGYSVDLIACAKDAARILELLEIGRRAYTRGERL